MVRRFSCYAAQINVLLQGETAVMSSVFCKIARIPSEEQDLSQFANVR